MNITGMVKVYLALLVISKDELHLFSSGSISFISDVCKALEPGMFSPSIFFSICFCVINACMIICLLDN